MKNIDTRNRFKLFGLLTYMAVWIGLFLTYKWFWGDAFAFPYKSFYLTVVLGYIFVIVFQSISENRIQKSWSIIWYIFGGIILLQVYGKIQLLGYGDQAQLADMMMRGVVFPRWMGGSAILLYGYRFWTSIPNLSIYSADFHVVTTYAKVFGGVVMMFISINLLKKWPNRMSVILPLAAPIYLMFSIGYDEYYPFVAGILLVFLMNVIEKDPTSQNVHWLGFFVEESGQLPTRRIGYTWQNVYWLGFLLAILPVFYFPFLIISLIVLAYYWFFYSSIRWKLLLTFVSVYILSVYLFWPNGQDKYISSVFFTINTGDTYLFFTRYLGQAANDSIFFSLKNVTTWQHFSDLSYMFFWSGNLVNGILLGYGIYQLAAKRILRKFITAPRSLLLILLFAWQLFYFVFMIPRLGPRIDIDLFFSFYICLAFTTGYILDFIKNQAQLDYRIDDIVIPAVAANAVVALFFLVIIGIPEII